MIHTGNPRQQAMHSCPVQLYSTRRNPFSPEETSFFSTTGNDLGYHRITSFSSPCPLLAPEKINPVLARTGTPVHFTKVYKLLHLCFTSTVLLSISASKLAMHFYKYCIKEVKIAKTSPMKKIIDYILELGTYMPKFYYFALQEERLQYLEKCCEDNIYIHKKLRPESLIFKVSQVSLRKCTDSTLR